MSRLRRFIDETTTFIRRVINSPVGELSRAQRRLRFAFDLVFHCGRALRHDRAGEMAAALTYRTIFSLIPLLVTLLLVFQAFRGMEQVKNELQPMLYKFMKMDTLTLPADHDDPTMAPPAPPAKPKPHETEQGEAGTTGGPNDAVAKPQPTDQPVAPPAAGPVQGGQPRPPGAPANKPRPDEVMIGVDALLKSLTEKVAGLNFGSIGAVGFVLFLWAAIDLAVTLELSFNRVFNCTEGRPWLRRIPIYWAVITLGPVLVWASLSVAGQLVNAAEEIAILSPIVRWSSNLFALAASWLLLFLVYKLMPNTVVNAGTALAGSFVAAVLWEIAKWGFGLYVSKAIPYAKVYGALGLIPLFLFWLYVTWLIVLFGLEVTYTLQALQGRRFKYALPQAQTAVSGDPQWLVPIITHIGQVFTAGKAIDGQALAERIGLPERIVTDMCGKLQQAGLVHRVVIGNDAEVRYSLALPPDQIRIESVLKVAESIRLGSDEARNHPGWVVLRELSAAQRAAAGEMTLARILAQANGDSGVRGQESGDRGQETGVRGQETGDRSQESGERKQATGLM